MVAPVISSLPVAPQRTDLPATFSERADAFVAALQPFRNQLNDALAWQNLTFEATDQALNQANQARNAAQTSASNAEQSNQESQAAKDLSQQWAESDDPVEGGRSSKYWKEQAEVVAAAVQSAAGLPSLVGNGLNVLTVNADEQTVEWLPGVQSLYSEFTESGTFTPDPRARWVYVECLQAGPGGGGGIGGIGSGSSGAITVSNNISLPGVAVSRLYRKEDIPGTCDVVVGLGGEGGSGYSRTLPSGAIINQESGKRGGHSYFISETNLSTALFSRMGGVDSSSAVIAGYGTNGGKGGDAYSNSSTFTAMGNKGADGLSDVSGKTIPVGGNGAQRVFTANNQTFTVTGAKGGDASEAFVSGAGGGAAASSWGEGNPPPYNNLTVTLIGGDGGKGGAGSAGGSGGNVALRMNTWGNSVDPAVYSVTMRGGKGGKGGDGLVRIWQW